MIHERDSFGSIFGSIPLAPSSDCSYFPGRPSTARAFRVRDDVTPEFLESALNRGYRRCGDIYYQQFCRACNLCINYRVLVEPFTPTKSQKRVARRGQCIESRVGPPVPSNEKAAIYLAYQYQQHHMKPIAGTESKEFDREDALTTMQFQMYQNPSSTSELELFLDGRLVGFGIFDVAMTSASAVYFVYDPEFSRYSLGTLAILRELAWCKQQGIAALQLGYFIPGHAKMLYKQNFQPGEYLHRDTCEWRTTPPDLLGF